MKTIKLRLLAAAGLLAAITITSALPANAQRRGSDDRRTESPVRKDNNRIKSTVQKRSTFKDNDSRSRDSKRTPVVREKEVKRDVRQKSAETPSQNRYETNRSVRKSSESTRRSEPERRVVPNRNDNNSSNTRSSEKSVRREIPNTKRDNGREAPGTINRNNSARENIQSRTRETRERNSYSNSNRDNSTDNPSAARRNSASRARTIYKLDNNDRRYGTNNNYEGSKEYWSNSYRSSNNHYRNYDRKFYRNYDYRKYNHWDNRWENYRWNHYSWIDYYNGYHPYSYKFHRHYSHHPTFGHVIRRFVHRPVVFFHQNNRYYCYDGHFFRYHRGIGYVLVDIPFGMVFSYLPHDYDRVFINGYLYFRVGNLFFEYSDYGYRLVHYPERYFAYSDDFYHDGYIFDDMY